MRRHSDEYWAGLFDGEGSIWLAAYQRKGSFQPQVSLKAAVSNTHRGIIEDLVHDFPPPSGRVINSFLGGPKDQIRRRQQYKWEMSGRHAYDFLVAVSPWLTIKREQAILAMEFYNQPWRSQRTGRGGGWKIRTAANVLVDLQYAKQIKELKRA